jgi:hypothetical protein
MDKIQKPSNSESKLIVAQLVNCGPLVECGGSLFCSETPPLLDPILSLFTSSHPLYLRSILIIHEICMEVVDSLYEYYAGRSLMSDVAYI